MNYLHGFVSCVLATGRSGNASLAIRPRSYREVDIEISDRAGDSATPPPSALLHFYEDTLIVPHEARAQK
jgi:hypothetical protein